MARRNRERMYFPGFDRPESNFFRMPNSWTDITAEIDNIAELKVVEYILRHTWGYQEYDIKKHITIDEFVHGRRRLDGSRMDKGTGLSERAVYDGLRKAVENGLVEEEVDDTDRGRVKKFYSVRMVEKPHSGGIPQTLQSGMQTLHPHLHDLHPTSQSLQGRGATVAPRTEKDTVERQEALSNFERAHQQLISHEEFLLEEALREVGDAESDQTASLSRSRSTRASNARSQDSKQTSVRGARRHTRTAPATESEIADREFLRPFLEDFARELGDEAPLSSTITRTLNIFSAAAVPAEQWDEYLYQARASTQERTGQIRKITGDVESMQRKNKMPYFFATLEQLVGLRPVSDRPRREGNGV